MRRGDDGGEGIGSKGFGQPWTLHKEVVDGAFVLMASRAGGLSVPREGSV